MEEREPAASEYRWASCFTIILISGMFAQALPAHAACVAQPENGSWVNVDPDSRSISAVDLRSVCQDQIVNGRPYPPGPPWRVNVFGSCRSTECAWGEVGARRLATGHIHAAYEQGFVRRHVQAKMSERREGELWLHVRTVFKESSDREDHEFEGYFEKR